MVTTIHDKRGNITSYGLACGYVHQRSYGNTKIELYEEHNTYHVKVYRNTVRQGWYTFDTLAEARRFFAKACRDAVPTFEVFMTGDPYSRSYDCRERAHGDSWIYRGDVPGLYSREELIRWLRRSYPGCKVRTVSY